MYTIVDLKGVSLSGTSATITGTYKRIASTNKVKVVVGINFGGTKKDNSIVDFVPSGSGDEAVFTGSLYGKVITVTVADAVSIADPQ